MILYDEISNDRSSDESGESEAVGQIVDILVESGRQRGTYAPRERYSIKSSYQRGLASELELFIFINFAISATLGTLGEEATARCHIRSFAIGRYLSRPMSPNIPLLIPVE